MTFSGLARRRVAPPIGRRDALLLVAVVAFGCWLRFLGLRLGLPYFHHWDEVLVTGSARAMLEHGNDVPTNFYYGAPLMRLTALGWKLAAALHLPEAGAPFADEVSLRWVARAVGATISGAGVAGAFLSARWTFGSLRAAGFAALAYAVAAELVWHARYGVTDASVVALSTLSLAFASGYLARRTLVMAVLSIVFAGLAFGFKLTGLATIVLPVGALVLVRPLGLWREGDVGEARLGLLHRALLASAAPLVLAIFLFTNPHLRDQWKTAFSHIEGIARHYREGHVKPFAEREPGLPHLGSAVWYLLSDAFHTNVVASLCFSIPALVGVGLAAKRREPAMGLALLHAAGVVVSMAWPNRAYLTRMYLPALPVLCLGLGLALDEGFGWVEARAKGRVVGALPWLVAALMSGTSVAQSIACHQQRVDPRVRAIELVASRASGGVRVALSTAVAGGHALGGHPAVRRYLARPGLSFVADVSTADDVRALAPDYVVAASHRDLAKIWPYEEQWSFTSVEGYREIARFLSNPYEERYDQQPTWDGHVTAIVLERAR